MEIGHGNGCNPIFEDLAPFEKFIEEQPRDQCNAALAYVHQSSLIWRGRSKATADRFSAYFDRGMAMYERRFGEMYVPF